jgi:hypothetical protein
MSDEKKVASEKRSIQPVTLTVTVEATKISEKGTFSGFTVKSVKGPNATCKATGYQRNGGGIYIQVETLEGVKILGEVASVAKKATKLF